jgi:hypothetical protein
MFHKALSCSAYCDLNVILFLLFTFYHEDKIETTVLLNLKFHKHLIWIVHN